jgi:hypothetical protein
VKRSGRDEPIWVVIHMCMETMIGISLHSYLHLKLAKTLFSLLSFMISLQNWRRGQNRFCLEARGCEEGKKAGGEGRGMVQTMYTHMNK